MVEKAKIKLRKSKNIVIYAFRYFIYLVKLLSWKLKHSKFIKKIIKKIISLFKKLKHYFKKEPKIAWTITSVIVLVIISIPLYLWWSSIPRAPRLKTAKGDYLYKAQGKDFTAFLGSRTNNTPTVQFVVDESRITFTPASGYPQMPEPTRDGKTLTFRNVYKNIDYEYQTIPNGIKENIIIRQPTVIKQFPFYLDFAGAVPEYIAENLAGGVFYDKDGNYIFHFEKPYAVDAKGARTESVQLTVKKEKSTGKYAAIVGIDPDWANAQERIYPIYVDPTVVHDESSEFATGQFNRVKDTGSGASPNLETYYQELPADVHTAGLWHMNEGTDNTCSGGEDICDFSGNDNHGSFNADAAFTSTSRLGNYATTYDGTGDYTSAGDIAVLDTTSTLSVCAWIYPNDVTNDQAVFGKSNTFNDGWYLFRDETAASSGRTDIYTIFVADSTDTSNTRAETATNTAGTINTWNHVCFTYETGKTDGLKIYYNGEVDPVPGDTTGIAAIDAGANPFTIGARSDGGVNFNGIVDEVIVSTRLFTPEEIKLASQRRPYSIYSSPTVDLGTSLTSIDSLSWTELGVQTGSGETVSDSTNLVAQWNFNETSGTNANNDAEGTSCGGTPANCDGTLTGFSNTTGQDVVAGSGWTSDNRRWGAGGLMFDGAGDYVDAGGDSSVNLTGAMSISFWMKRQQDVAGAADTVISKIKPTNAKQYAVDLDGEYLRFGDEAGVAKGGTPLNIGESYFITVTYDGSSTFGGLKLYINGIQDSTSQVGTFDGLESGAGNLFIGQKGNSTEWYSGTLDSVQLYSRTLGANEILANYNAGQIEFQTRTSSDGSTWEAWKPTTGETQIESMDSSVASWGFEEGSTSHLPILTQNTNPSAPTGPTNCSSNRPVLINNLRNSTAFSNFQVKLEVDYLTGMSSDFSDLRFTNASGTDIDYWTETYTASTDATLWVEVDSIPAKTNTNIFMWYNGCTGGNSSNGDNTFSFFDDFEDGTIDATKWPTQSLGSYITETGGELKFTGIHAGNYYIQSAAYTQSDIPMIIEARTKTVTAPGNGWSPVLWWQSTGEGASILDHGGSVQYSRSDGTWTAMGTQSISSFHHNTLILDSTSTFRSKATFEDSAQSSWFLDNSNTFSGTYYIKIGPRHDNGDYGLQGMDGRVDALFVREYSSVEPIAEVTTPSAVPSMEGSSAFQATLGKTQLAENTVALFHLDETSGTGAYLKDATNYGNHGTPSGTATINGFSGKGRSFSSGNYISHPVVGFNPKEKTIEMWIKPNWNGNDGAVHGIWQNNNTTSVDQANWVSLFKYSSNVLYFRIMSPSAGFQDCTYNVSANTYFSAGKWVHLVATYSASGRSIYLNGDRVCNLGAITPPSANLDTTARIGYGYSTNSFGSGIIDEVKISNNQLGWEYAAEAYRAGRDHRISTTVSSTDLSSKGKLPFYVAADRPGTYLETTVGESAFADNLADSNTIGFWKFEEAINDTCDAGNSDACDSSSVSADGDESGGSLAGRPGKMGKSRYFDGSNDYVDLGSNTIGPELNGSSAVTVSAWLNISSYPAASANERVLNIMNHGFNSGVSVLMYNGANIRVGGRSVSSDSFQNTFTPWPGLNAWHHFAGVMDYANDNIKIYIDGQLAISTTVSFTNTTYTQGTPDANDHDTMGSYYSDDATGDFLNGYVDELHIEKVAKSADEIRQQHELELRTHPVTIDFAASLDSGNLITGSGDTSFTVDATSHGLSSMGSQLFVGDKIIVKENVDGTEYIAQGDVTAITASTGATTIDAWDTGSTFPSGGYTVNATVFKWQREEWDITKPLDAHLNAATKLTIRATDGSEGRNVWIDDFESAGDYLTTPGGSTVTSTTNRYLQYRAILSSTDTPVSPSLTSVTIDYTENVAPGQTSLEASYLHDKLKTSDTTPEIRFSATDGDSDNLSYKVEWDTDSSFPSPTSVVSDTDAGFADITTPATTDPFTSGDVIAYTFQTPLSSGTTYFYRVSAKDPGGTNTYGTVSATRSFTIDTSFGDVNGWHETHADQFSTDTLGGNAQVNASGYIEVTATTGTATSTAITASNIDSTQATWGQLLFTDDETFGDIKYKLYYDVAGTPTIIPDGALAGNSTGFDTTGVDLTGLSTTTYSILYAYAELTYSGGSPQLQDWTVSMNVIPNTPTLDSPSDTALVSTTPALLLTATDPDTDNIQYKIVVCEDVGMSVNCQTFDQTQSQTGWSGQNADGNTTYTSGTQGTYTVQSALTKGQTYYWQGYAIDPSGVNIFGSAASAISFTVSSDPTQPTALQTDSSVNPVGVTNTTPAFSAICNDPDSGEILNKYRILVDNNSDFSSAVWDSGSSGTSMTNCTAGDRSSDITFGGTPLTLDGTTYYWKIKFWDALGNEGVYSTELAQFTMATTSDDGPTNCRIQDTIDDSSLTLLWDDNSSSETQFRIEKNTSAGGFVFLINKAADSTSHLDSSVSQGNTYQYRVRAENGGTSNWCTTGTVSLQSGTFESQGVNFQGVNLQ